MSLIRAAQLCACFVLAIALPSPIVPSQRSPFTLQHFSCVNLAVLCYRARRHGPCSTRLEARLLPRPSFRSNI